MSNDPEYPPALDDVADGDESVGEPVAAEHDVDIAAIAEEADDE